ncbi:MAG: OmpA family protein [Actinomycetota bacterium]
MERPSDEDTDALLRELIPGLDDEEWGDSEALSTGDATLELQAVPSLAGTPLGELQPEAPADAAADAVGETVGEVMTDSPVDLPPLQRSSVIEPPTKDGEPESQPSVFAPQPDPQEHTPVAGVAPPLDAAARTSSVVGRPPADEPPRWITPDPVPGAEVESPSPEPSQPAVLGGAWAEKGSWPEEPDHDDSRPAAVPPSGSSRLTILLIALSLAVVVGAIVAVLWWFQAGDDAGDTAAVGDDVNEATGDEDASEADNGTDGDGVTEQAEGDGTEGADTSGDDGLDPVTGEAYPGFLDLFSLAEFTENRYPHGLLDQAGTVTFRGRIGSQDEIDAAVADMEAIVGPGNVIDEFELTPGFPSYTTGLIFLDETILFESNSTEIDPVYEPFLASLLTTLAEFPDMRVAVVGHADSAGDVETNIQISRERAQAVFSYLTERGANAAQISTEARGETDITDVEALEMDDADDRRVEFVVDFDGGS